MLVVALASACLACGSKGEVTSTSSVSKPSGQVPEAVDRAMEWLDRTGNLDDPTATLVLSYVKRRFAIPAGDGVWGELDPDPTLEGELAAFRRLVDPGFTAPVEDILGASGPDALTVPALYCDRIEVPPGHLDVLEAALGQGPYEATHAVLALTWMGELGCLAPEEFRTRTERAVGVLVEIAAQEPPTDVAIEAAVMLHYAGHGDSVSEELVAAVLDAQNSDGGWSPSPGERSSAHTTALAVWLLSEEANPDLEPVQWIGVEPRGSPDH